MLKFYIEVSNSSYISDYLTNLVYNWYDDEYRSKALFTIPLPLPMALRSGSRT